MITAISIILYLASTLFSAVFGVLVGKGKTDEAKAVLCLSLFLQIAALMLQVAK